MNISYNWLKDFVDFDLTPHQVADALTSIGLETGKVEEIQAIKGGLEGLVIGEVLTCIDHPNSDHLHITTVNIGQEEPLQIVCGAANVAAGQKVVVATIGTKLYFGDDCVTIKKSKMRGVESLGMICAEDEIGVGTSHEGIIVLPDDVVPGTPAKDYYNIKSDYLLEVDITPNRADACSHYGVARDLYAYLKQQGYETALRSPFTRNAEFKVDNHDLDIDIEVENGAACPRYSGITVKGVKVQESPDWLKNRLHTIGIRSINNIVDVTNYIVFETGQPLHCFDADKIGRKVVVKNFPTGTPFVTLDGVSRKLDEKDLMICNENAPMCIAGVFGGLDSGVTENTVNIFIESAYFNPTSVRKTARRHGLSTDASFRYERGIDPLAVLDNLKHAAMMMKELGGGEISSDIKEFYPVPFNKFEVELKYDDVEALVGKKIEKETVKNIVSSLEMEIVSEDDEKIKLLVPPYRVDVQRPCDVIEDILRIYGYNNIDISMSVKSCLSISGAEDYSNKCQNLISEQLVGAGFYEMWNNSLTKSAYYDGLNSFRKEHLVMLMNPLSSDLNSMRQTLLFGGLECIAFNMNHKSPNLKFFEFGNCYYYRQEKRDDKNILSPYDERYKAGLWICGKKCCNSWAHAEEDVSVYELKAYVENIFRRLGLSLRDVTVAKEENDIYSVALAYKYKEKTIAKVGVVSRHILKSFDIDTDVYYAEIEWHDLLKSVRNNRVLYQDISKYPAVRRDLALLVDKNVTFEAIKDIAFETEKKLLKEVALFDVYEGKNLESGKKSYAVYFILQDEKNTLTDKVIEKTMSRIVTNLESRLVAKLR